MTQRLRKIDDEVWKPLEFTDRPYEISNYGRIKSFVLSTGKSKILKCANVKGFLVLGVKINGKKEQFCVHKLTARYFVPKESEDQTVVIHKDWNKSNNYYKNLKWVTKRESYDRMKWKFKEDKKGQKAKVTNSKLTEKDVVVLKTMLASGIKQNVIAKLFAISEMQVSRIKKGENWAHVKIKEDKKE